MIRIFAFTSAAVLALAVSQPAWAQNRIQVGQTLSGELSASDPTLDDGSHFDCYDLQTQAGQRLQIDQTSSAFDSFLSVARGGCRAPASIVGQDDDGGGGLHSRVTAEGDGAVWAVVANSVYGGATGPYQVRVTTASSGGGNASQAASAGPGGTAPPSARPTDALQRYTWDLICLAADQYAKINHGVAIDDPDSMRLMQTANASGEALGKDFETVADELMTVFMPYTSDPDAYFSMGAPRLRDHCIGLL